MSFGLFAWTHTFCCVLYLMVDYYFHELIVTTNVGDLVGFLFLFFGGGGGGLGGGQLGQWGEGRGALRFMCVQLIISLHDA